MIIQSNSVSKWHAHQNGKCSSLWQNICAPSGPTILRNRQMISGKWKLLNLKCILIILLKLTQSSFYIQSDSYSNIIISY